MGPLLAAAAAAAARTRERRGAVSPASSSVTFLTCIVRAPPITRAASTPHHPRRAPRAGEIADPRGCIVRLSPAPRHLGQEILKGGGACHAHCQGAHLIYLLTCSTVRSRVGLFQDTSHL